MFYENELKFLCDVFEKCHVNARVFLHHELLEHVDKYRDGGLFDSRFSKGGNIYNALCELRHHTVYKLTDVFYRSFLCVMLPLAQSPAVLFIGPFLSSPMTEQRILILGEEMNISPQKQQYLSEYYLSIPMVLQDGHLMVMFNSFCELIWNSPSFDIEHIHRELHFAERADPADGGGHGPTESLVNIRALEVRYSFENELLNAVSFGQIHLEDRFMSAFSPELFEKRADDPLRNAKNYAIIMNTLMRKAAEKGGVHPVYLDHTSSDFAMKIEGVQTVSKISPLMGEMFRTYCRLVRRHTMQKYSPAVSKTLLTIDADLSADLSAGMLASSQGLSLGYLSTLFRREVGKTISSYVRQRRIEHAEHLLSSTDLQIQTVALHCGIMDVQYFTKLFKKQVGMTPTSYRLIKKTAK